MKKEYIGAKSVAAGAATAAAAVDMLVHQRKGITERNTMDRFVMEKPEIRKED